MARYNPFGRRDYLAFGDFSEPLQFKEISTCLVRRGHSCGKFLGASKSCFIACPSTEEIEPILALITEKLARIGIEAVIAIKDRAYGQDIFCTKICGKIIESQFCIVILDDTVEQLNRKSVNIPNPNVYYEYGLMTTLGKVLIPLQKEGHNLAFNIQTHDTIKYTNSNISSELDRALKDAVKATQEDRSIQAYTGYPAQRLFHRSMEIMGYQRKDHRWFLSEEIADTNLVPYGHSSRREYVFFSVETDKGSIVDTLTDIQVVIKRLEAKCNDLIGQLESANTNIEGLEREMKVVEEEKREIPRKKVEEPRARSRELRIRSFIDDHIEKRDDLKSKLELIQNSKFAIVLMPEVKDLQSRITEEYDGMDMQILKLPLYIGDTSGIQLGDLDIPFRAPTL